MTALRADGPFGQVEFDGELVKITRDGRRATGPNRTFKAIDLVEVKFSAPTAITRGFLTFVIPGLKPKFTEINSAEVQFPKKLLPEFSALNDSIQRFLDARGPLTSEQVAELAAMYAEGRDEANRENREEAEAEIARLKRKMALAEYSGHIVDYKGYRYGLGAKRPIAGASADYESGADRSRPTITRIGAGAILAGPVGAIAGGMFKKDKTKGYVTIDFPDGNTVIIDGPAKDEKKMRKFAAAVNQIATSERQRESADAPEVSEETPVADQLLKLKHLHEAGVLTDEQYAEKSEPLIAQL